MNLASFGKQISKLYTSPGEIMVKLIPLVQDLDAWKHHFRKMSKGIHQGQNVISKVKVAPVESPITIKIISPTEAALERAKAQLKQEKQERKKRQ